MARNKFKNQIHQLKFSNYWTPLTSQVEALESITSPPNYSINHIATADHDGPKQHVTFKLPRNHRDRYSTKWRHHPRPQTLSEQAIKQGVLNGTFPSAISNTGAPSSADLHGYPFILTTKYSTKVFHLPNSATAPTSKLAKLHHHVRKPVCIVDMVSDLVHNTLLSASKFADADYIYIYDGDKFNKYYGHTIRINVS